MGAVPTSVLVHDYTRHCLCHLRSYFHHLTLDLSIDSGYLGLTLSFSENVTCWSFVEKRGFQMSTAESCSAKFYKGKKINYR